MESVSWMEYIIKGMNDNIYNYTVDGKCRQCGNCCTDILPMSQKEVDAIHRYIKENDIKECKNLLPLAKPVLDMLCPFLDTGKSKEKCRIYPVRPFVCKKFICDNEQRAKLNRKELEVGRIAISVRDEFFGE